MVFEQQHQSTNVDHQDTFGKEQSVSERGFTEEEGN